MMKRIRQDNTNFNNNNDDDDDKNKRRKKFVYCLLEKYAKIRKVE